MVDLYDDDEDDIWTNEMENIVTQILNPELINESTEDPIHTLTFTATIEPFNEPNLIPTEKPIEETDEIPTDQPSEELIIIPTEEPVIKKKKRRYFMDAYRIKLVSLSLIH